MPTGSELRSCPAADRPDRVAAMNSDGAMPSTSGHSSSYDALAGTSDVKCTSRPMAADSRLSTSTSSLLTVDPSASSMRTAAPDLGSSSYVARKPSSGSHSRGCFALATLPVSMSTSPQARSPRMPLSVMSTAAGCSPSIDFTGKRLSVFTVPTVIR